jgi:hypothetical protein
MQKSIKKRTIVRKIQRAEDRIEKMKFEVEMYEIKTHDNQVRSTYTVVARRRGIEKGKVTSCHTKKVAMYHYSRFVKAIKNGDYDKAGM